ncbi:MAG: hypothetical protein KA715_02560 [Xanthomonadaceae bacterium]|nr:hypothetical protein [Xanthomonadaceae bacterium]
MRQALGLAIVLLSSILSSSLSSSTWASSPFSVSNGSFVTITDVGNPMSAFENPAQLAAKNKLSAQYGWNTLIPQFSRMSNILLENNTVSDKTRVGNLDPDYRTTIGQLLGLRYALFPEFLNFSIGLSSFLPWSALAYYDSGETFSPEFVLDRSRSQRPEVAVGFGIQPLPRFNLGASLRLGYNLTARANVMLQTNPVKPSSIRFLASLRPFPVPIIGSSYQFSDHDFCPNCSISGVVRFPADSSATLDMTAASRVFGDTAAFAFQLTGLSSLYFDPWSLDLGFSVPHLRRGVLKIESSYQRWSTFKPPTAMITNPQTSTCENGTYCPLNVSPSQTLPIEFKDILIVGITEEWMIKDTGPSQWFVKAGAGYRPSIVKTSANDTGNYNLLDPSRMMYTLGGRLQKSSWSFDVYLAYHQLETQNITKASSSDIGAPGYTVSGSLLGGGANVSFEM